MLEHAVHDGAISIHAPLTGSDRLEMDGRRAANNFNPRSPYGERRAAFACFRLSVSFQSTLPLRGATIVQGLKNKGTIFQSTLPLRGATTELEQATSAMAISIHAPLTGSDLNCLFGRYGAFYFNPRSPYGERHRDTGDYFPQVVFQSTLPLRGATNAGPNQSAVENFNPRSPYGERRGMVIGSFRFLTISIHAPLTGSDSVRTDILERISAFQSTLPLRGATPIDPPWRRQCRFQSTLPLRGATTT